MNQGPIFGAPQDFHQTLQAHVELVLCSPLFQQFFQLFCIEGSTPQHPNENTHQGTTEANTFFCLTMAAASGVREGQNKSYLAKILSCLACRHLLQNFHDLQKHKCNPSFFGGVWEKCEISQKVSEKDFPYLNMGYDAKKEKRYETIGRGT